MSKTCSTQVCIKEIITSNSDIGKMKYSSLRYNNNVAESECVCSSDPSRGETSSIALK